MNNNLTFWSLLVGLVVGGCLTKEAPADVMFGLTSSDPNTVLLTATADNTVEVDSFVVPFQWTGSGTVSQGSVHPSLPDPGFPGYGENDDLADGEAVWDDGLFEETNLVLLAGVPTALVTWEFTEPFEFLYLTETPNDGGPDIQVIDGSGNNIVGGPLPSIPEPTTGALAAGGALLLTLENRRKRQLKRGRRRNN